jgi:hypothetical protein
MLEHETLGDQELQAIFGDIETWVDPDPSGLDDAPPAPVEPPAPADDQAARAPVTATEAEPVASPVVVPNRPTAERARWRLRWRFRPGPTTGT